MVKKKKPSKTMAKKKTQSVPPRPFGHYHAPATAEGLKVLDPPHRSSRRTSDVAASAIMEASAQIRHLSAYWSDAEDAPTGMIVSASERSMQRARCLHAMMNCGFVRNSVRSFGNHVIGAEGPTVRLDASCGIAPKAKLALERAFWIWQLKTQDIAKLRLIARQLLFFGESIERFVYEPSIPMSELSVQEIEPRRLDYPEGSTSPNMVDGILFDGLTPAFYFIEKQDINPIYQQMEYEKVPADQVMHVFFKDLPDQHRGIPVIATVLRLQGERMLWEAHTLSAADWAARWGGFISTNISFSSEDMEHAPGETMLAPSPGEAVFTPEGWEARQVKPEFPTSTFEGFDTALNREICAGLGVPFGVAGADTSAYSYSSWRGEKQNYWTYVAEVQTLIKTQAVRPRFAHFLKCHAWYEGESCYAARDLLAKYGDPDLIPYTIRFPLPPSVDPEKDAKASQILLSIGATSLHKVIEEAGGDYDETLEERRLEAIDAKNLALLGGTLPAESPQGETDAQ